MVRAELESCVGTPTEDRLMSEGTIKHAKYEARKRRRAKHKTAAEHGPDHGGEKHTGDFTSTRTGKHYAGAKRTEDFGSAVERRRPKARSSSKKYPNQK